MDTATITNAITGAGVIVAIGVAYFQNDRARFSQEIALLTQLDTRFESAEFRAKRRSAAAFFLAGCPDSDGVGKTAAYDLLNAFETLAYLHRKEAVSSESAWHYFGYWIIRYFEASRSFLQEEQLQDPKCYDDFIRLKDAVFQVERDRRNYIGLRELVSDAEIRSFLNFEKLLPDPPAVKALSESA